MDAVLRFHREPRALQDFGRGVAGSRASVIRQVDALASQLFVGMGPRRPRKALDAFAHRGDCRVMSEYKLDAVRRDCRKL